MISMNTNEHCLRCQDTPTFKRCKSCGEFFDVDMGYQSYRLPTRPIKDQYSGHSSRFWHYDLCETCLIKLQAFMKEFLHE